MQDLCDVSKGGKDIKMVSTTHVKIEPAQREDFQVLQEEAERRRKLESLDAGFSEDEEKEMQLQHIPQ
jgi:hypothetical protein